MSEGNPMRCKFLMAVLALAAIVGGAGFGSTAGGEKAGYPVVK
jgi:hypothetical protein